ncbi:MAG: hypothetical protein EPN75_07580 [Beijerinckiaceae bacterium]|nr:MAG: hypothetical protein EPN75_07580 [Beijerinckiaceae bacterium]
MRNFTKLLASTVLLSGMMIGPSLAANSYTFKLVKKIALPTKAGHGDGVVFDPSNKMVYVSMVDGMAVIDTRTNKVVHAYTAEEIPAPNYMAFDDNYVYETVAQGKGKRNQIVVISKKTWKIVDTVNTSGTSPDGAFADPANKRFFVVSDDNNWIEAWTAGPHPTHIANYPEPVKNPVAGPDVASLHNGTIYGVNDSYLFKMNPNNGEIEGSANYHLKVLKHGGTKANIFDKATNEVWVATTHHLVLVVDAKTLDIVDILPQSKGADDIEQDPGLGLAYDFQSSLPGFDVYDMKAKERIATIRTGTKHPTHTGAIDPDNHEIYAYVGGEAAMWVYKPVKAMATK